MSVDRPAYSEALETVLQAVNKPRVETLTLKDARGRTLASDLHAPADFPDLPRSAVDGFALRHGEGSRLRVVMEVAAGHPSGISLKPGEAASVMTGGVVPAGADCVVKSEDCRVQGDQLDIDHQPKAGDLINHAGSEVSRGQLLAVAGTRLDAGRHAALMGTGLKEIPVYLQPRVGIMVTGDELREAGAAHQPGMVFNSNQYVLEGLCAALAVPYHAAPVVPDDPEETSRVLADLCGRCDFVVSTGGVSVGNRDFVRTTLESGGYEILVAGTRIKPGRPFHLARRQTSLVFALPGYPAAAMANAMLYLVPALKLAGGRRAHRTTWLKAITGDPFRWRPGSQYLARVSLSADQGQWVARDTGTQLASQFLDFVRADGLIRLPVDPTGMDSSSDGSFTLPPGSPVDALHFGLELS